MRQKSEIHKVLEDSSFEMNQQTIPLGGSGDGSDSQSKKDHRIAFTIGAFNDAVRRLLTEYDETVFGIQKNQEFDELRQYFTHRQVFNMMDKPWDADLSYEFDHKYSKFLSREKSIILRLGPQESQWKLKLEHSQRKNLMEHYSSREFLSNETTVTYKNAIGLQYVDFNQIDTYKKIDIDLAIPTGIAHSNQMPAFIKLDALINKSIILIKDKLKLAYTLHGGLIKPILGQNRTYINDRFFISNSLGYSHIGHVFKPNALIDQANLSESTNSKKIVVGDDLGSENFILTQARLEFLDIPYLSLINFRTFTYAEMVFYPNLRMKKLDMNTIKESLRFSAGFGISIPLNPMISILLYYNALNINSQKVGDFERRGYFNINLGFF